MEEIQKGKSRLKSSKSYPDDFLKKQKEVEIAIEDGDNSSSGVSSDQEIPGNNPADDSMNLPSPKSHRLKRNNTSVMSRHAVSLAQLPPPLESENDEKEDFCLPPPPEFGSGHDHGPEAVLAPPPQFSDSRQVTRVRIVGTVPKGPQKMKQGRLHSQ